MLSIIVFLSCTTTTIVCAIKSSIKLWIAFNYCIFIVYDHNVGGSRHSSGGVVNCFQLLYFYRVRPQHMAVASLCDQCCELLSIIVFLSCTTTTIVEDLMNELKLWIAFNYCISIVYDHNKIILGQMESRVVNCFQLLYFYRVRPQLSYFR